MPRPALARPLTLTALALCFPALASAGVPKVATDIAPTQSLVALVMGDLGQPSILLSKGANAHSYQMRPSEARALDQADLVIWIGPEMTPWLDRAIAASGPARPQLALLHAEGTKTRSFAGDGDEDEHEHEEGHDHGQDHEHTAGADGTILDPHAWLNPGNAETWLTVIADRLGTLDPEHKATYAANAEAARARIAELDARLEARLKPVAGKPFVVYHDAYGYFADRYGLADAGSVSPGDATDPGAAHLSELRAELSAKQVVCAFPEAAHDPRPMQRLIEGTTTRLGGALDPAGTEMERGPDLYVRTLDSLGDTLLACLDR